MNISKLMVVVSYFTGGVAGVVQYVLDRFNGMISGLPSEEVAKYSQLAKDIAEFVSNVANIFIKDEAKKAAALTTAQCFGDLANALQDSKLEKDELDTVISDIQAAVKSWKEAK